MTISLSNNSARVSYSVSAGASQTSFTVPFEFFDADDLTFYVDGTAKTLTTHYTVSGGNGSTGTISTTAGNTVTGISGGSTVVITRDIDLDRVTDFPSSGPFAIATLNTELDRFTAIAADQKDEADRALRLQDFDSAVSMTLPLTDARKGTVLGFNATTGVPEAGPTIADVNSLAAITTNINTVAGISSNVTTVAGISSNVTTVAGISSNVTSVAGNASNINAVVSNASNINTVAGNISNVNAVGAKSSLITSDFVSDLNTLAVTDVINDINTLATSDIVSDLNTLATSDIVSDLNTLATSDIVSDINTLATSDIVTDLNLLATSDFVSDLNTIATTTNVNNLGTVAGAISNVNSVASNASNINSVAGNSSNINAAVSNAFNINSAVSNASNITTVAGISSDVTAVAGISSDVAAVENIAANVTSVAGNASNINAAVSNASNINAVVSNASNINSVAGIAANVTTVAGIASNVTTVAGASSNVSTVAGAITNVNNVGGSIANVNTVATNLSGVNSFAERYRVGSSDPTTSLDEGDLFYNTTSNSYKFYNGSSWNTVNVSGIGSLADDSSPQLGGNLDTNGNNINFGDNDKASFSSGKLEIYHDGTNAYIDETYANGTFLIRGNNISLQKYTGETMVQCVADGKVELNFNNVPKLETTSTGVSIPAGQSYAIVSDTDVAINRPTTNTLGIKTGNTQRMRIANGGDISFYADNGTTQGLFWDASTQRLGLGTTTPVQKLDVYGGNIAVSSADTYQTSVNIDNTDTGGRHFGLHSTGSVNTAGRFRIYDYDANVERMTITSGGNVGINDDAPNRMLQLKATGTGATQKATIMFENEVGTTGSIGQGDANSNAMIFTENGSERLRIQSDGSVQFKPDGVTADMTLDALGNLIVGKTSPTLSTAGSYLQYDGFIGATRDGNAAIALNRLTSDGDIALFQKSGTTVGSIGTFSGNAYFAGSGCGLRPRSSDISPTNASGSTNNAGVDLGTTSNRFNKGFFNDSVRTRYFVGIDDTNTYIEMGGSDVMKFVTGGTERMRITSAGSVGISTSSPVAQSKLTVAGNSLSVTGSDGNFAAGGQRTFMDFAGGKARIGSTGGGAAGTTLGLYVGTGHEAVSIDTSGNLTATGNVTAYSDERLKSDITTIDNALDKVTAMRGVTFTKDGKDGSGVIAQELENIAPELVVDGEEYKSVAYGNLVGYLIEAVKELSAKVEALENGSSK